MYSQKHLIFIVSDVHFAKLCFFKGFLVLRFKKYFGHSSFPQKPVVNLNVSHVPVDVVAAMTAVPKGDQEAKWTPPPPIRFNGTLTSEAVFQMYYSDIYVSKCQVDLIFKSRVTHDFSLFWNMIKIKNNLQYEHKAKLF